MPILCLPGHRLLVAPSWILMETDGKATKIHTAVCQSKFKKYNVLIWINFWKVVSQIQSLFNSISKPSNFQFSPSKLWRKDFVILKLSKLLNNYITMTVLLISGTYFFLLHVALRIHYLCVINTSNQYLFKFLMVAVFILPFKACCRVVPWKEKVNFNKAWTLTWWMPWCSWHFH